MNFESIVAHHVLDHTLVPLTTSGGIEIGFTRFMAVMLIVAVILIAVLRTAAVGQGRVGRLLRGFVEPIVLYLRDAMIKPIFHEATTFYLPYFLTLFFFILAANLFGLIPFSSTVTGSINVTAALAACSLCLVIFAGIKEQGLIEFIKHICPGGVPWWLMPLLFVIEIVGIFAKCFALTIRLFANMIAGHVVSLAALCLIFILAEMTPLAGIAAVPGGVGLAVFIYLLEVLVAFIQAYIFTFMTALVVGAAVHPH